MGMMISMIGARRCYTHLAHIILIIICMMMSMIAACKMGDDECDRCKISMMMSMIGAR